MDPLAQIKAARNNRILTEDIFDLIYKRFPLVVSGIQRIEKASQIHFPIAYVDPSIIIADNINSVDIGILFARTIPVTVKNSVQIIIQISAPLVAYGLKGTIHAVLAHEFLHYLELVTRLSKMEIVSDEISGNLFETRSENWSRGAQTLDFLKNAMSERFNKYNFEALTLIGHSNGGDISAWLGNEEKAYIHKIITLDHRRVPLPRNKNIQVLSIRASDFPADRGVLLTDKEQEKFNGCIVKILKAKHNDIADFGPLWLKKKINFLIESQLNGQSCSELKKA